MDKKKPQKRHLSLQPLSREHHQGLLLAFKIGKGISKEIEGNRIKKYVQWFYENYLLNHFTSEEKFAFPLLGNGHKLVKQALEEHQIIKSYIYSDDTSEELFKNLQALLKAHIRMEERELFNLIEAEASEKELEELEKQLHEEEFCLKYSDEFW